MNTNGRIALHRMRFNSDSLITEAAVECLPQHLQKYIDTMCLLMYIHLYMPDRHRHR